MNAVHSGPCRAPNSPDYLETLETLLEDAESHLQTLHDALDEAKRSPFSLHTPVAAALDASEALQRLSPLIGENFVQALASGAGAQLAELCLRWADFSATTDGASSVALVPPPSPPRGSPPAPPTAVSTTPTAASTVPPASSDIATASPTDAIANETADGFPEHDMGAALQRHEEEQRAAALREPAKPKFATIQRSDEESPRATTNVIDKIARPMPQAKIVGRAATPKPVDLSTKDLNALFANGRGFHEQNIEVHSISTDDQRWVRQMIKDAGNPPPAFRDVGQARSMLGAVRKMCDEKSLERISKLPKAWHFQITNYMVAYLRHVQEATRSLSGNTQELWDGMDELFRRLTVFSEHTRPGFIVGLKLTAEPDVGGTWHATLVSRRAALEALDEAEKSNAQVDEEKAETKATRDDALRVLNDVVRQDPVDEADVVQAVRQALALKTNPKHPRLLNALADHEALMNAHEDLHVIARSLRAQRREAELAQQDSTEMASRFQEPWPFLERTKGKKMALIGGNRNAAAERRIREAFGLGDLVWVPTQAGHHARQQKFHSKLKNGTYDYVVAIQNLVGHAWTDLIFNNSPARTKPVLTSGYGIEAIRRALEQYLGWRVENDDDAATSP